MKAVKGINDRRFAEEWCAVLGIGKLTGADSLSVPDDFSLSGFKVYIWISSKVASCNVIISRAMKMPKFGCQVNSYHGRVWYSHIVKQLITIHFLRQLRERRIWRSCGKIRQEQLIVPHAQPTCSKKYAMQTQLCRCSGTAGFGVTRAFLPYKPCGPLSKYPTLTLVPEWKRSREKPLIIGEEPGHSTGMRKTLSFQITGVIQSLNWQATQIPNGWAASTFRK